MIQRRIVGIHWERARDCASLGSYAVLTLDCGHVKRMKASAAPLAKTRCPQCEELMDGRGQGGHDDDAAR